MTQVTRMVASLVLLAGLLIAGAAHAQAPEPSVAPRAWELQFTHGKPQPIVITTLEGDMHWYWFMTYKVVNNTGREMLFIPEATVATDRGHIIIANHHLPPRLFPLIQQRVGNRLLQSPIESVGQLLQGEDHARESVIIWRDLGQRVDRISIFVSGLSGETATIQHPETGEPVVLRKTLQIDYALPGSDPHPQTQPVLPRGQRWVMR
jgi:hypothetical protein